METAGISFWASLACAAGLPWRRPLVKQAAHFQKFPPISQTKSREAIPVDDHLLPKQVQAFCCILAGLGEG